MSLNSPEMENIFGVSGLFASRIPGYEYRPGQLDMASAVARLLAEEENNTGDEALPARCLVIEAETGLGKTLAYLIPAILSGRRVVVSTNTRNLQDQILQREIPLIQELFDPSLKVLCVKGRQNYLCLHRWQQLISSPGDERITSEEITRVEAWLDQTVHAERSELGWLPAASPLWQKICCHSHGCLGADCPETAACFLNRLRRDAAACRLLIVNHHLLFSDLAVRRTGYGEVLPRYETVIFDEAHHVEQVATTFFGVSVSRHQMVDLAFDVDRSTAQALPTSAQPPLLAATARLTSALDRLITAVPVTRGRFLLHDLLHQQSEIAVIRDDLLAALTHLAQVLEGLPPSEASWAQYADRARDLTERLQWITAERFDDLPLEEVAATFWYERTERNLTLSATPVDVAEDLRTTLFTQTAHCIFTSATLTTGNKFTYFFERLGLPPETPTLSLPSPFDYRGRTLLYLPETGFPEPAAPGHAEALHDRITTLITHAGGRTLALFTSFAAMDRAFYALKDRLPFPLLVQGEAPRRTLLKRFNQERESVLFAVASFWEGVDIPGESLSLVIIDKLPFEVPSDPVIMARINRIKAQGGNPFASFQIPRAILTLRQGVGRLMRTGQDHGVIALLDTRLVSKGYGRQFLKSLPPSTQTRDLDEVAAFFQRDWRT